MKGPEADKTDNELPPNEHTIWLLDQFRGALGNVFDVGNDYGSIELKEPGTRLIWRLGSIGADGSGTDYVSDLYEPLEQAPDVPTVGENKKIKFEKIDGEKPVFRSGKEKNKRENWKVVCADGGHDLDKAAVPGYGIGGDYPVGSGEAKIEDSDREKTTKKYWTDWYGSSWGGWVTGMFGGGSGSSGSEESGLVKVEIAGRNGKKQIETVVYTENKGTKEIEKKTEKTEFDVPGSSKNPLLVEPAQIWRRRLTWGLGWWRTELVPHVGTDRMGSERGSMSRTGIGSSVSKYAGGAHDEHVTVMGLNRSSVTRRVVWKGGKVQTVEVADQTKGGTTLKAEADNAKTNTSEWNTTETEISGTSGGTQETIEKTDKTVKQKSGGGPTFVIQTETDTVEKSYRAKEGNESTANNDRSESNRINI